MRDYISADLYRLFRYGSYWIGAAIGLAIYLGATFMVSGPGFSSGVYGSVLAVTGLLLPMVVGLGVIGFVYNHDVRAGALKVAIGRGLSRERVVAVKTIELLGLVVLTLGVLYAVFEGWNLILGLRLEATDRAALQATMMATALQMVVFGVIAGGVAIVRQETTTSTTVFALLASSVLESILGLVLRQDAVIGLIGTDLTSYLPGQLAAHAGAAITSSTVFSVLQVVVLVGWLAVPVTLTVWLFQRTELEF